MINFVYSFLSYLVIIVLTILISKKFGFYDIPNSRKIHKIKVLNTSGVSLYIYLLILLSIYEFSYDVELIISYGIFLTIFGFLDDRISLNFNIKLICIIIPSIFLILNGFELNTLGDYEYIGTINLGKFNIIFTLLAVGLLINAYNYVDGVDGLLSSLLITTLLYIIFLIDNENVINLLLLIIIPLSINLIFNLLPAKNGWKIFLGDCGSLFLGFFASFLIIYISKFENIHPAYLIWSCWYPVYDFLYVTSKRLINKKGFYKPDNSHFHHIILKYLKSDHYKTIIFINSLNIFILYSGFLVTKYLGYLHSLIMFVIMYFIFWALRDNKFKKNLK